MASETDRLIAETLRIHEDEEHAGAALNALERRDSVEFVARRQVAIDACDARIDHTHHAAPRLARMLMVAVDALTEIDGNFARQVLGDIERIAKGES